MANTGREKVALFVCNDLTGLLILNRIVPGIKAIGYDPVIFNTGINRNRTFKIPTPPLVSFFNATLLKDVLIPTLESQPVADAPNHTYRQLAAIHGVEYRDIESVNDPAFIAEIAGGDYRGGIAVRFLQVFEKEAINVFHEKGFLWNLHSGLLPDYKGLLTPFRAIENGEKTYGLTLHDLTCKIDEGDIIGKGVLPLDREKPVLDLYLDSVPTGADLILQNLTCFKSAGQIPRMPQGKQQGRYYTNPTQAEFRKYAEGGVIYTDPESTVERLSSLFAETDSIMKARLKRELGVAIQTTAMNMPISTVAKACQRLEPIAIYPR